MITQKILNHEPTEREIEQLSREVEQIYKIKPKRISTYPVANKGKWVVIFWKTMSKKIDLSNV